MTYQHSEWDRKHSPGTYDEIARLWNNNAVGRHAFFPWTGELLHALLTNEQGPIGRILTARAESGELVGYAHTTQVSEDGYPPAGVVEALLVDSGHRRRGVGTALLDTAVRSLASSPIAPGFVDALGAWPFGYAYNTLADGSERSGVFYQSEAGLYRLFRGAGFQPVKRSTVMRAELSSVDPRPVPSGAGFYIGRRTENTWLDRVFRGRELWDHDMGRSDGLLLSRSIFGFMERESHQEGRCIFSLFGVNTPRNQQGKGYAGVNLSQMMAHVRELGGEVMELHVYSDNLPALALYRGLGFKPIAETAMMHKRL